MAFLSPSPEHYCSTCQATASCATNLRLCKPLQQCTKPATKILAALALQHFTAASV